MTALPYTSQGDPRARADARRYEALCRDDAPACSVLHRTGQPSRCTNCGRTEGLGGHLPEDGCTLTLGEVWRDE